jgi:hypothetical protein
MSVLGVKVVHRRRMLRERTVPAALEFALAFSLRLLQPLAVYRESF